MLMFCSLVAWAQEQQLPGRPTSSNNDLEAQKSCLICLEVYHQPVAIAVALCKCTNFWEATGVGHSCGEEFMPDARGAWGTRLLPVQYRTCPLGGFLSLGLTSCLPAQGTQSNHPISTCGDLQPYLVLGFSEGSPGTPLIGLAGLFRYSEGSRSPSVWSHEDCGGHL